MKAPIFKFIGRPRFEDLEWDHPLVLKAGRQISVLLEDFSVDTPEHGLLTARAGMTTDRASIPRWGYLYIAPNDPCMNYPAVIHDAGYEKQGAIREGKPLTREEQDELLRQMAIACGCRASQAWVIHQAVRFGGRSRWQPSVELS